MEKQYEQHSIVKRIFIYVQVPVAAPLFVPLIVQQAFPVLVLACLPFPASLLFLASFPSSVQ